MVLTNQSVTNRTLLDTLFKQRKATSVAWHHTTQHSKVQSNQYITVTFGKWPGDRYIQGDCCTQLGFLEVNE